MGVEKGLDKNFPQGERSVGISAVIANDLVGVCDRGLIQ
jgi:hypothetical protein